MTISQNPWGSVRKMFIFAASGNPGVFSLGRCKILMLKPKHFFFVSYRANAADGPS